MKKKNNYCLNKAQKNDGFTIIEVLIAIFVFAIAGMAIIQMQIKSIQGNANAANLTEASFVMSAQIENLASLSFSDPLLNAGTYSNATVGPVGKFNRQYTITDVPVAGSATEFYKRITVTTSWNDHSRRRQLQATTIKLR